MDSPRSIQACLNLGIQASELIQLDLEEFKEKYPEVRSLSPEMLKYRYNAAEKFRIQSINLIKKERQRIMEEDEVSPDGLRRTLTNMSRTAGSGGWNKVTDTSSLPDDKMEQILMEQKKAIQKIKQKQRQDIQAMIKEQIDKEISEKVNIEKQRRQREKEEENMKELERMKLEKERKLKQKEKRRIGELNRQLEEQKMKYKLKEDLTPNKEEIIKRIENDTSFIIRKMLHNEKIRENIMKTPITYKPDDSQKMKLKRKNSLKLARTNYSGKNRKINIYAKDTKEAKEQNQLIMKKEKSELDINNDIKYDELNEYEYREMLNKKEHFYDILNKLELNL